MQHFFTTSASAGVQLFHECKELAVYLISVRGPSTRSLTLFASGSSRIMVRGIRQARGSRSTMGIREVYDMEGYYVRKEEGEL